MQLFEYKVVNVEHGKKNEEEALNKLGQDGWELVAVVLTNSGNCITAYFKKPIEKKK